MNLREVIIQFNSRFDPRGMLAMLTTMRKAKTEAEAFEQSLQKITAAFMGMGSASVLAFKNYEMALTEFAGKAMNTATQFGRKFARVSGKISRDTGLMRYEVLRGLQEATSALLPPEDAAALTRKAAILDAGNQSRMRQSVGVALSGYRNKFGKPAKVLDYTYASAQLGQGQVPEFAPALQYVFGFARGAGLELKEVAAGLAAISATAPSPIMGSTQFGAFLTGIARGSTYEKKLIEQGGVDSQGLRDMLRHEGLARTVEFLASKFTGDELQQVFGRKEFVQFVQGTTGRRGIVSRLEKMITANAESGPIENFGKDLEWTLQNKWDRFLQTMIQMGVEYGKPLATAAKLFLEVGRIFADALLLLNEVTGGAFAWVTTAAGSLVLAFTVLGKTVRAFTSGLLGRITGFTNMFVGQNVAAGAAVAAAPWGAKGAAARSAAAEFAASAGLGAGMSAGEAVANGGRPTVTATPSGTASARAQARASATPPGGASDPYVASVDTGAKDWNERRRERMRRYYERMRTSGDEKEVPRKSHRTAAEKKARHQEVLRARASNYARFTQTARQQRLSAQRVSFASHVMSISALVDDMVAKGHVDPAHRRFAIQALLNDPHKLNAFQAAPKHGFGGWPGLYASTGFRPLDQHVNPFSPDMVKKKHRRGFVMGHWGREVDWNKFVLQKYRTGSRTQSNILPHMVMKSQEAAFAAASMAPWLDPDLYLKKHRDTVAGFGSPLSGAGGYQPTRPKPKLLGAPPQRLLSPPPPLPRAVRPPPARGAGAKMMDWIMGLPLLGATLFQQAREGGTYRNLFGGGSFASGFTQGVDGSKFNDFLGAMADFNSSEEKKGRKGVRTGIAQMAFFLGKMFRLATNPVTLATAAVVGAVALTRFLFNRTERGKEHLTLLEMKKASFFTQEKILKSQAELGRRLNEKLESDHTPHPRPDGPRGSIGTWESWLQQPEVEIVDAFDNFVHFNTKKNEALTTLNKLYSGTLDPEGEVRAKLGLKAQGVKGWKAYKDTFWNRLRPGILFDSSFGRNGGIGEWGDYLFDIEWEKDHDRAYRVVQGKQVKSLYEEQGRQPLSAQGIPWYAINTPYFQRLAAGEGPLGPQREAYSGRALLQRLHTEMNPSSGIIYIPIESAVTIYADSLDKEGVEEIVEEHWQKNARDLGRRLGRDAGVDVGNSTVIHDHPGFGLSP